MVVVLKQQLKGTIAKGGQQDPENSGGQVRLSHFLASEFRSESDSGQHLSNYVSVNVSETHVAAAETIGQPLVIETKLVQDSGMNVVNRGRILRHAVSELIRTPVRAASLESAAGEEDRVTVDVVIASHSVDDLRGVRRAAHLTGPEDDG